MRDIAEVRIRIRPSWSVIGLFLTVTSLICGRTGNAGVHISECFICPADCPRSPVGILEICPAGIAVPVIDDDIGYRLNSVLEQHLQCGPVLVEGAVAIIQLKVLFRIITGAGFTCIRWRRQPDQVEAGSSNRGGEALYDDIQCLSP